MKKFLTFLFAAVLFAPAFGQLPDGETGPNFNALDINGKRWNLYDILESGRPVIMDVSATWCGPCWSYHNSHALEDYFAEHGPEGDGQSFVFFVEGDGATNLQCLYGPSGCVGGTQGNWVAGTPYPILDNANIKSAYSVSYFPTIYLICPDKKVKEIGQIPAASLWAEASACVGNVPVNAAKLNDLVPNSLSGQICQAQTATPTVTISNLGTSVMTNAKLELRWNGTVIQTKDWNGTLPTFSDEVVVFDAVSIPGAGTLSVTTGPINGDAAAPVETIEYKYIAAPESFTTPKVVLQLRTDATGGKDIYWEVLDDAGNVLKSGGNVKVGPNGGGAFPSGAPADPSAYANGKTYYDTIQLAPSGCFTFRIVDGVGDGLKVPGNFKFLNLGSSASFYSQVGFSGKGDSRTFAPKTSSGADDPISFEKLEIFPNPAADVLTVNFTLAEPTSLNVFVTNSVGQTVRSEFARKVSGGDNQLTLDVADLANGIYFLNLRNESGQVVRKFTVTH